MNPLPNYPGSKGGSGVDKRIVSLMPPHLVYVEAFLGGGAVLRLKKPAALQIGLDLDPTVIDAWTPAATPNLTLPAASTGGGEGGLCIAQADALEWLASLPPVLLDPRTLVYCDPPYLRSVRTRLFYRCEMADTGSHLELLDILRLLPCYVMVSHYPCRAYDKLLARWRRVTFQAMTHGGPRTEAVWCNFPAPRLFHDPRFLGEGFRERERIKRKSRRWQARFAAMSAEERQVVALAMAGVDRASPEAALRTSPLNMTIAAASGVNDDVVPDRRKRR